MCVCVCVHLLSAFVHVCIDVFGCLHAFVCVCVCMCHNLTSPSDHSMGGAYGCVFIICHDLLADIIVDNSCFRHILKDVVIQFC